jgi:membrane fusion protein, multidrug efflux system
MRWTDPAAVMTALLLVAVPSAPGVTAPGVAATKLATVRVGDETALTERMLDGTVEAVNQATVSAQTAGRVTEIKVDVNDYVPAGTLVMRLRSTEQVAGLSQAQAALKEATAREAEAQTRYDRIRDMYSRQVVAKATLDEATAARDAAAARLVASRAALDAAREGASYTEIRAPYAGVVTQKFVQVGETVALGTPLIAGASLDALRVIVEVPQSIVEQVRAQNKAAVYVDDRRIESTAITFYPSAVPQTNTFRARIELPKNLQGLAPGMFVKVGFVTGESQRLLVPRAAIVERSEMRAVYVVAPDGRVSLRQVRLGHAQGDRVEILAGLAAGDLVALDPAAAGVQARQPAPKHD